MTPDTNAQILDSLYTVAMEPERFRDLVATWQSYLDMLDTEEFSDIDLNISMLLKHIERASALVDAAAVRTFDTKPSLHDRLDRETQAMLAVSGKYKIEALNASASASFPVQENSALDELPFSQADILRLKAEIDQRLSEESDVSNLLPSLIRVVNIHNETPAILSIAQWSGFSDHKFALIKMAEFLWPENLTPVISKAFNLTQAEADIVKLIVEGASVQEVAELRGSQVNTVRTQIRNLYAKTGTRSQSEFIRMAIGLTTLQILEGDNEAKPDLPLDVAAPVSYPRREHIHMLTLSDGRTMEYAIFGSADGRPCVFFHNEILGNVWPAKIAEYAIVRGLRIIIPARPFYGESDPYPKGVNFPTQTAKDIAELLDFLELGTVFLIGQTLGGAFALVFADHYPERVSGMLSLSPLLPHASKETEQNMPAIYRFISSVVQRSPAMLDFVGRAGSAYYKRVGPIRFIRYAFGDLECDRKILNNPEHQEALIRGINYGAKHGHKGYVAGYKHVVMDADEMLAGLNFQVKLLIGDSDKNTRMERAQALIDKGLDLKIIPVKGGGELLMYSHPTFVIDEICKAIDETKAV